MATFITKEDALIALREVQELLNKAKAILDPVAAFSDICGVDGCAGSLIDGLSDLGAAIQEIENELAEEDDNSDYGPFRPFAGMILRSFYVGGA